jgi:hypothetical protein
MKPLSLALFALVIVLLLLNPAVVIYLFPVSGWFEGDGRKGNKCRFIGIDIRQSAEKKKGGVNAVMYKSRLYAQMRLWLPNIA